MGARQTAQMRATVVDGDGEGAARGARLVLISDTHGMHRQLTMPPGDVLLHAGDFTRFGKEQDAIDFNDWVGSLGYAHTIVALGNHEHNAPWRSQAREMLSNCTLLVGAELALDLPDGSQLRVFATDFCWPMDSCNPSYDLIPEGVDVLVAHSPARGHVDGGKGCPELLRHVARLKPALYVCGHIHYGHGVTAGRTRGAEGVLFANAANAQDHGKIGWAEPIVVNVLPREGMGTPHGPVPPAGAAETEADSQPSAT
jgi:hypothetical protein